MERKWMLLAATIVIAITILALEPDEFVIGTYSHFRPSIFSIYNSTCDPTVVAGEVADLMIEAHYNTMMEIRSDYTLSYSSVFADHGIHPIVYDDVITESSFFNDVEYQAEYLDPGLAPEDMMPDHWPEEMKWYRISTDIAFDIDDNNIIYYYSSNDDLDSRSYQVWEPGDGSGYVVAPFKSPWNDKELYTQLSAMSTINATKWGNQIFKLTFRMRIDPADLAGLNDTDVLCRLGAQVMCSGSSGLSYVNIPIAEGADDPNYGDYDNYYDGNEYTDELCIDVNNWNTLHQYQHNDDDYVEFEFYTEAYPIFESGLADPIYIANKNRFNLCPTIYFYNDYDVILNVDWVGIMDNYKEDLDGVDPADPAYERVQDVIDAAASYPSTNKFTGRDEPFGAQWRSSKRINEILGSDREVFTSVLNKDQNEAYAAGELHLINKAFITEVTPKSILPQFYPCRMKANWVEAPETGENNYYVLFANLQGQLSLMCDSYKEEKAFCMTQTDVPRFCPCVQSYGVIQLINNVKQWNGYILPPSKLQKVLAFLPLCYDADGIFYYNFESSANPDNLVPTSIDDEFDDEEYWDNAGRLPTEDRSAKQIQQGPVLKFNRYMDFVKLPQYYALQEVHKEMEVIVPIIKTCVWDSSKVMTLKHDIYSDPKGLSSVSSSVKMKAYDPTGIGNYTDYDERYDGYVECAQYSGGATDYFMLVNRRANIPYYKDPNDNTTLLYEQDEEDSDFGEIFSDHLEWNYDNCPSEYIDQYFAVSDPQTVEFEFTGNLSSYALVDAYTLDEWEITYNGTSSSSAEVEIEPGDGMLLCLQPFIPETLTQNLVLNDQIVNHDVTVPSGKFLYLQGGVRVGSDCNITVEYGGTLYVEGTNYMGTGSSLVILGDAYFTSGSIKKYISDWDGIYCSPTSEIDADDFTFVGGENGFLFVGGSADFTSCEFQSCEQAIYVSGSADVTIDQCDFNVPGDGTGIYFHGNNSSTTLLVTGLEATPTTFAPEDEGCENTYGIRISSTSSGLDADLDINTSEFTGLSVGIQVSSIHELSHSISGCDFIKCSVGINLVGSGKIEDITDCAFDGSEDVNNPENFGISSSYMKVHETTGCTFSCCNDAIYLNNVVASNGSGGFSTGPDEISECNFNYNTNCFKLCASSPYIIDCIMSTENDRGMLICDLSLPDCSYTANNVFANKTYNLDFMSRTLSYFTSEINLFNGHNDFYHWEGCTDMHFASDFDGSTVTIDATCNYFQNNEITLYNESPLFDPNNVYCNNFDADPNVDMIWPPHTRTGYAMEQENEGNLQIALDMYRVILTDRVESEVDEWTLAVDKAYILTVKLGNNLDELKSFFESLIGDVPEFMTAEDYADFEKILNNYIKKCEVELKNFQAAADIVIERLENATTAEDSIYAQMDLETINVLADLEGGRAAVVTKYPELKPESMNDYRERTKKHWDDLNTLYGIEDEVQSEEHVPAVPVLSMNYPNPFNPTTTICFSVPEESKVEMDIYNIKGQKVKRLVNDDYPRGNHKVEWHGDNSTGKQVSSGVYFYRLKVNGKSIGVKKMLMLK